MSPETLDSFAHHPILDGRVEREKITVYSPHILKLPNADSELKNENDYSNVVVVITGPPGGGKDTLVEYLMNSEELNFAKPKTATTRSEIRPDEMVDDPYIRMSFDEFHEAKDNGHFIEFNPHKSGGRINWYGTPKESISKLILSNQNVVLRIDPNGAKTFHDMWLAREEPFMDAILLHAYIVPPQIEHIYERLLLRERARSDKKGDLLRAEFEHRKPQILTDLTRMNDAHLILINPDDELPALGNELANFIASMLP